MPLMAQSRLPDDYIHSLVSANPFRMHQASTPDKPLFLSAPGRIALESFVKPRTEDMQKKALEHPQYEITLLLTADASRQMVEFLWPHVSQLAQTSPHTRAFASTLGQPNSPVRLPWRDQNRIGEKSGKLYDGFNPGHLSLKLSSRYQAEVMDAGGNIITDLAPRFYNGAWVIVAFNLWTFNTSGNKGINAGLQNIMLVADDQKLISSGGGMDSKTAFAGIKVDARLDPVGMMAGTPPPPGVANIMPPPQVVGTPQLPPGAGLPPGYSPPPGYGAQPAYAAPALLPGQRPGESEDDYEIRMAMGG